MLNPYSGKLFTIFLFALAAYDAAYACGGHQVTLVGCVDEHSGVYGSPVVEPYAADSSVLLRDGKRTLLQTCSCDNLYAGLFQHVEHDCLCDLRLIYPLYAASVVLACICAFAGGLHEFVPGLVAPHRRIRIILVDAAVEFGGYASYAGMFVHVSGGEARCDHASQVFQGADDGDAPAHSRGLDSCYAAAGASAVNANLTGFLGVVAYGEFKTPAARSKFGVGAVGDEHFERSGADFVLAFGIVISQFRYGNAELQLLALAGFQLHLAECLELLDGSAHGCVTVCYIDLDDLFAGAGAAVAERDVETQRVACAQHL